MYGKEKNETGNHNNRIKQLTILGVTLILMMVILFLRKPDAIVHPQFWAEDGAVFFQQQYLFGLSSLIIPYAGYLHVVPRIIANIAGCFPLPMIPNIYNYFAFFLMIVLGAFIFNSRFKNNYKPLLALALVLTPYTFGVFTNVTNLQWPLSLFLLLLFLQEAPSTKTQTAIDFVILFLVGLTGPFILFCLPLFAWKALKEKNEHNKSLFLIALGLSMLQGELLAIDMHALHQKIDLNFPLWCEIISKKYFGYLILGEKISSAFNPFLLLGLFIAFLFYLFSIKNINVKYFVYFGFVVAISSFYRMGDTPEMLTQAMAGDRFVYLPYIMIIWSLICGLDSKVKLKKILSAGLLICILINSISLFSIPGPNDRQWEKYISDIPLVRPLRIPINPDGWYITFKKTNNFYGKYEWQMKIKEQNNSIPK